MYGIYIHIPFCASKCPYCDFYSLAGVSDELKDAYVAALMREMHRVQDVQADTLYFGGGTPAMLGGERLARLGRFAREQFDMPSHAEITLEANPADHLRETFLQFADAGGNRLSLGMQSSDAQILRVLGRRHTPSDVARTVADAQSVGIHNISLDMMLAVPSQTVQHIERDAKVCVDLGVHHVSAYLLKLEEGTPFFMQKAQLDLPDEDTAAELYLAAAEALETHGYAQYEISNFSHEGMESRHNLKYWDGAPYLGFGPAAHSFANGERYAYPRDIEAFIRGNTPVKEEGSDLAAGDEREYEMLRLRLTAGLQERVFLERFGKPLPTAWREAAARLPKSLVKTDENGIAFTREGFLVSNTLIACILNL